MKLVIDHLTRYGYDEEVKFSTQYLRLTPRSTGRQKITAWSLTLPDGSAVATTDAWGNVLHVLTLDNPHKEITIRASGIVDIAEEGDDIGAEPQELLSPLVFLRCTPLTRADGPIREFAQRWYQPEAQEVRRLEQRLGDLGGHGHHPLRRLALVGHRPGRQPRGEAAFDDGGDQVVLVLEMPVDRAGRQPALLADQRDAGAFIPAFGGDLGGGVEDPFPRLLAIEAAAARLGLLIIGHLDSRHLPS